jgi:multicomponent Na+:H+ antiporter subunit G
MIDTIGIVFIGIGLFFDLFGCIGLIRMPDVYNRLQAATKCVTFGTCSIMFGTFLVVGLCPAGAKALLCIVFIALTAPVSAHALARAAYKAGVPMCDKSTIDKYSEKNKE